MSLNISQFKVNDTSAYLTGVDISLDANRDTQQPASCKSVNEKLTELASIARQFDERGFLSGAIPVSGEETDLDAIWGKTIYIPTSGVYSIEVKGTIEQGLKVVSFYDDNFNELTDKTIEAISPYITTNIDNTIGVPEGASYVRFCLKKTEEIKIRFNFKNDSSINDLFVSGAIPVLGEETNIDKVWMKTSFVPIKGFNAIRISGKAEDDIKMISFYDIDYNEIEEKRINGFTAYNVEILLPSNANYLRLCVDNRALYNIETFTKSIIEAVDLRSYFVPGAIPVSGEETSENPKWQKTDYIPILSNDIIYLTAIGASDIKMVSFYKKKTSDSEIVNCRVNGSYIVNSYTIIPPIDANYVRFCIDNGNYQTKYQYLARIYKGSVELIDIIKNTSRLSNLQIEALIDVGSWKKDAILGRDYVDIYNGKINKESFVVCYCGTLRKGVLYRDAETFDGFIRIYGENIEDNLNIKIIINN